MAHLAALAGFGLAVEVQAGVGFGRQGVPLVDVVAQQIGHLDPGVGGGRAQRPAGEGADMLFELVADAAVLGPVAGVVDARRDLIDQQQAAAEVEQFDADHSDVIQPFEDGDGDGMGAGLGPGIDLCGCDGRLQDAALVDVLTQRIDGDGTVAAAGADHRQFALECGPGL